MVAKVKNILIRKVFLNKKTGQLSITLPKKLLSKEEIPKTVKIIEW